MSIPHSLRHLLPSLLLITMLFLNGCSMIGYYSQSIEGQLSILYNREPIDTIINDPKTDPSLKNKLQQVKAIRKYASDSLFLPNNKSYLYYTDLHRPYVVWNIFAAPEFSLKPLDWCYPIVGCVSYRGYFDENNANEHAAQLSGNGYDTHVAGIAAYSTLGWFNDPFLSSMAQWREQSLAGLIFHELSHQVLYISNETGFNEAFASSVERIGRIQWLMENHPEHIGKYIAYLDAQNDFRNLLRITRNKLSNLYDSSLSDTKKRKQKSALIKKMTADYGALKRTWPKGIQFDYWFSEPINNARFTSSMTYLQQIPAFYALFVEANGDWLDFYSLVKAMENETKKTRDAKINKRLDNHFNLNQIITLLETKQH